MLIAPVTLAKVPKSLLVGIDRRLPRGNRFKDLTGKHCSGCVIIGLAGYKGQLAAWLCRCNCGKPFVRAGAALDREGRKGCGCGIQRKSAVPAYIRSVFKSMKSRCYSRGNPSYPWYGACGIKICKRWLESVETFYADMGPRPSPKHLVARRNPSGDYTPNNCYWGTRKDIQQSRTVHITYNGTTMSMADWAKELGISRQAMAQRVKKCEQRRLDITLAVIAPVKSRHT
jgi:hypothetical protein